MNLDIGATILALLTFFGIYALIALSLNLEYGAAGIANFGKAFFVSVGAYTAGVTYTRLLPVLAGREWIDPCGNSLAQALQLRTEIMTTQPIIGFINFLITLVIAGLVGGTVGFLVSYVSIRLKQEWYLALVLLAGSEIGRTIVRDYDPLICGHNGLSGIAGPFYWLRSTGLSPVLFMLLILVCVAVVYVYAERLIRSPYGRLLRAVRENEAVARSLGKDVVQIRAGVMFIGSMIAAFAGVLFALNTGFVSTNDFVVTLTLDIWVMVVLGGPGNNRGALLGAFLITVLDRVTAVLAIQINMMGSAFEFNYARYILFGLILLLVLRFRPQGLIPETRHTTDAHLTARKST